MDKRERSLKLVELADGNKELFDQKPLPTHYKGIPLSTSIYCLYVYSHLLPQHTNKDVMTAMAMMVLAHMEKNAFLNLIVLESIQEPNRGYITHFLDKLGIHRLGRSHPILRLSNYFELLEDRKDNSILIDSSYLVIK